MDLCMGALEGCSHSDLRMCGEAKNGVEGSEGGVLGRGRKRHDRISVWVGERRFPREGFFGPWKGQERF